MKKARMNTFHFRFILVNWKIFGEIVTTYTVTLQYPKLEMLDHRA